MIDLLQRQRIKELQAQLHSHYDHDVLHVLNGQMMYEQFSKYQLMEKGEYVPFNEAMCSHDTTSYIFSHQFNNLRALGHNVSLQEYKDITVTPLQPLFERSYTCIVLWFGHDMFCQMNLLTVLALLEQEGYKGDVKVHMIDEATYDLIQIDLVVKGYTKLYEQILIHHQLPDIQLHPIMKQGIKRYLEYRKEENEITNYVKEYLDIPLDKLLNQLFQQFPHYGLGDVQYIELIKNVKKID